MGSWMLNQLSQPGTPKDLFFKGNEDAMNRYDVLNKCVHTQLDFKYKFYSKSWWNGNTKIIPLVQKDISYKLLTQWNHGKRISGRE